MNVIQRDHRIDNLRGLGTLLVILAHMTLPTVLLNIRTFDVILLVMVSFVTFRLKSSNNVPYLKYVWKRIKRLVIPTYVMLVTFFLLSEIISLLIQHSHAFDLSTIVSSFLFLDTGIPYIWIVRIFIVIAFFAPLIGSTTEKLEVNKNKLKLALITIVSLSILIVGGAFYDNCQFDNTVLTTVLRSWLIIPIIYVAITQISSLLLLQSNRWKVISILCLTTILVIMFLSNHIVAFNPDDYKTPPQPYWVFYGLIVSLVCFMVIPNRSISFLEFVSKNSLNIYLLHVIILMFYNKAISIFDVSLQQGSSTMSFWLIRYIIVLGVSCVLIYLTQRLAVRKGI